MKKLFLLTLLLFCASPSHAAVSLAELENLVGASGSVPLPVSANIYKAISANALASYNTPAFAYKSIRLSLPSAATLELAAPISSIAGSGTAGLLLRKGLGLLGPVATIVTVAMALNDLYNTAILHPTDYPLTSSLGATSASSPASLSSNVGDIVYIPGYGFHQVTGRTTGIEPNTGYTPSNTQKGNSTNWGIWGPDNSAGPGYHVWVGLTYPSATVVPPVQPATLDNWVGLYTAPGTAPYLQPAYADEAAKMFQPALNTDTAKALPTSDQITQLSTNPTVVADAAEQTAAQSAQTAADKAKAASIANPTDPNLANTANALQAAADALKAQQAAADAAKAQEDALTPPDTPKNTYDAEITPPDKKDIPSLLLSFVSGSPLVSMVKSFTVTTSDASCSMPIGIVYGQQLTFDFCRYQSLLCGCGGVLIIIMQGFAIFVVIRGW
ncbi:MAG: hypothetical protein PHH28_03355 [Desulfuromonadaceae bacterium]|nr:hypothetical protein [Desulfuromonadaceae bacterium]